MIKTFADRRTQQLYATGKAKRFPTDIAKRSARKLEYLDLAARLDDLKVPPGNRLHALGGDRKGQYSISINDQWRICFRFVDGDVYDESVEYLKSKGSIVVKLTGYFLHLTMYPSV